MHALSIHAIKHFPTIMNNSENILLYSYTNYRYIRVTTSSQFQRKTNATADFFLVRFFFEQLLHQRSANDCFLDNS